MGAGQSLACSGVRRRDDGGDGAVGAQTETRKLPGLLPAPLHAALRPFQRTAVAWCVARHGRAVLGDEMGLGKAVQALAVARVYVADWPLAVVCPPSLRLGWRDEALRWCGDVLAPPDVAVVASGADAAAVGGAGTVASMGETRSTKEGL